MIYICSYSARYILRASHAIHKPQGFVVIDLMMRSLMPRKQVLRQPAKLLMRQAYYRNLILQNAVSSPPLPTITDLAAQLAAVAPARIFLKCSNALYLTTV